MTPHSADLDGHGRARLSYQQAEALFTKASGGATLRQLRHSALPHDTEGRHQHADADKAIQSCVGPVAGQYARVSAEGPPCLPARLPLAPHRVIRRRIRSRSWL